MGKKTPWREVTTEDGYICLLHDNGKLYFGVGYDDESPQDVGRQCHKKVWHIGKRWVKEHECTLSNAQDHEPKDS